MNHIMDSFHSKPVRVSAITTNKHMDMFSLDNKQSQYRWLDDDNKLRVIIASVRFTILNVAVLIRNHMNAIDNLITQEMRVSCKHNITMSTSQDSVTGQKHKKETHGKHGAHTRTERPGVHRRSVAAASVIKQMIQSGRKRCRKHRALHTRANTR